MDSKKSEDQKVDVGFESHPPITTDLDGITTLLKQTLLHFVDCNSLARYLIEQKDVTQVIAQEPDEEGTESDDDDEPDDNIYGVSSVVEVQPGDDDTPLNKCRKQLMQLIKDKCTDFKKQIESANGKMKVGLVINERYINLPPQLSLPVFESLTKSLDNQEFTHLIFISKILVRHKSKDTSLPSKKMKSGTSTAQDAEPLIFVNPEEEILCEQSDYHADIDVSSYCDDNASWSFGSDIKYKPHRRILVIDYKKWPRILECLAKELNQTQ